MKRIYLFSISICLLLSSGLYSQEGESDLQDAFSAYNPIYFIVGTGDLVKTRLLDESSQWGKEIETDQMVKLSFSMKYQFFHQYKTGLYLGFTQDMFWDLFYESSPFSELNYNPDLFLRFESENNFASDLDMGVLDYVQIGTEHKSNGLAGIQSRGFDRVYGQLQLKFGDRSNAVLNAKYYVFYQDFLPSWYEPEIPDLPEYRSSWEFRTEVNLDLGWAFFLPHTIRITASPGGGANSFDFLKGYQQLDVIFGDVFGGMCPYVQIWNGYGEGLIAYDQYILSIRAGILLR